MKIRDLLNGINGSTGDSDATIAAYSDYFASLVDNTNAKFDYIINEDPTTEETSEFQNQLVSLQLNDANSSVCCFRAEDLRVAMTTMLDSDPDDETAQSFTLNDIDGVSQTITYDEALNNLKASAYNNQLTQLGFSALENFSSSVDEVEGAALDVGQQFSNTLSVINAEAANYDSAIRTGAMQIYQLLSDSTANFRDKINSFLEFTGLTASAEKSSAAEIEAANYKISDYTGIKPIVAWINGFDVKVQQAATKTVAIAKTAAKVAVGIAKKIGSLVVKGAKRVGKYLWETGVNPVDYNVDGKKIGYFEIPCRLKTINPPGSDTSDPMSFYINEMLSTHEDEEYWVSIMGCMYRIVYSNGTYYYDRYMKPLDWRAFYRDVNRYDIHTVGGLMNCIRCLQENDYSCPNDMKEIDVYRGLLLSGCLQYAYGLLVSQDYRNMYTNADSDVLDSSNVSSVSQGLYSFSYQLEYILQTCEYWYTSVLPVGAMTPGSVWGLITNLYSKSSVTNADFMHLLTGQLVYKNNSPTVIDYTSTDAYLIDSQGYANMQYGSSTVWEGSPDMAAHYPAFGVLAVVGVYKFLGIAYNYQPLFMPYTRGKKPKFRTNVTVKTDSQNLQAMEKLAFGVFVAAVVIAVGIFAVKSSLRLKQKYAILSAGRDRMAWDVGEAINSGDKTTAIAKYKQYKKLNRKANMTRALGGLFISGEKAGLESAFSSSAFAQLSDISSKSTAVKPDMTDLTPKFDSIYNAIR